MDMIWSLRACVLYRWTGVLLVSEVWLHQYEELLRRGSHVLLPRQSVL